MNKRCFTCTHVMEEVLDEVVLEGLCCHFQKISILVTPDFQQIPATILANPAIDVSMLSSFRDHPASTPWLFQLNLLLNS